uniref:Sialinlike protein putative n=1 Tax=Albugo laibachii Nc14 TaxID=890382 RepID=F0W9R2_9STRA|nr:sialinlike protein putative [Albugo laibachii Nc14]|eukprot:CCA17880.1 sialinlike protein putative [Albugo laibachii Nc14]
MDMTIFQRRYLIAFLGFLVTLISYAARTNIGIVVPFLTPSKTDQSRILSAFYFGYLATQVSGGVWARRYGVENVLILGVTFWTIFDVLTVFTATSKSFLYLSRAMMGLGEGIIFPCMHQISSKYPANEKSRLVSIVSSGADMGTIISMLTTPIIIKRYGWPIVFTLFGSLSLAWILTFLHFKDPSESPHSESDSFLQSESDSTKSEFESKPGFPAGSKALWRPLLTHRSAWAIYTSHFCYNYGWYVLLGWIPQYYRQVLHVEFGTQGLMASIPFICGCIGGICFGRLGDWLVVDRNVRIVTTRKLINTIAFSLSSLALYSMRFASASQATFLLSLTMFFGRGASAGYWVNMIDIAGDKAGVLMGVSNTIATIPGIIGNLITGYILQSSGSWDLVFGIASAVLIAGAVIFASWASDENIFGRGNTRYLTYDIQPLLTHTQKR